MQEHFWFTAMTISVNAFLLTHVDAAANPWTAMIISTVTSFYAAHVVIERSRGNSAEARSRSVASQLRFVVNEKSGSLFYLLLIYISWTAVVCSSIWPLARRS